MYKKDDNGVHIKSDSKDTPFSYTDGEEIEERLYNRISTAKDVSLASNELQALIQDWPSEYHLSPLRHNLLSFLKLDQFDNILEIGSGCGAITRLFGERGNQVVALEGSYNRAKITAARCRDLENVQVYCDAFGDYISSKKYDLISMIGVLEYSPGYSSSENPFEDALSKVRSLLSDNGILVVAIENQLGLKYFNACAEDHSNELFWGINNFYLPNTFRTFGKKELESIFGAAGFDHTSFYYPFPDYKLPRAIISDFGLANESFPFYQIIGKFFSRDYSQNAERLFIESRVWELLWKNRLVGHLANSFLIIASTKEHKNKPYVDSWCAQSFSSSRKKEFLTVNTFFLDDNGEFWVNKELQYVDVSKETTSDTLRHHLGKEAFVAGRPYGFLGLCNIFSNVTFQTYLDYLSPWIEFLKTLAHTEQQSKIIVVETRLPGRYLDCQLSNLMLNPDEKLEVFDLEWEYHSSLPLGFVVFRGVFYDIVENLYWYRKTEIFKGESIAYWIGEVFKSIDVEFNEDILNFYLNLELELQNEIFVIKSVEEARSSLELTLNQEILQTATAWDNINNHVLSRTRQENELIKQEKEKLIDEKNRLLHENSDFQRDNKVLKKDQEILSKQLRETIDLVEDCRTSASWKIGRLVTFLPRKLSQFIS